MTDPERLRPVKGSAVFRLDGREVVVTDAGVRVSQGRSSIAWPREFAEPLMRTLAERWRMKLDG